MHQDFNQSVHADINIYFDKAILELLAAQPLKAQLYDINGFISLCGRLYNDEERQFLIDVAGRFRRVELGFTYFALLGSNQRPFEALRIADYQPRAGWHRIGIPSGFNQPVGEHQRTGVQLANLLYSDHRKLELIKNVFRYHDCGEAVIGDFTPHCPISKQDKLRLEGLAVKLLTSAASRGHPMARDMAYSFAVFEGHVPEHADVCTITRDIDFLEMSVEARYLRHSCPPAERAELEPKLAAFDKYVEKRLTGERARAFFYGMRQGPVNQPILHVWLRAMQSVLKADKVYAALRGPFLESVFRLEGITP